MKSQALTFDWTLIIQEGNVITGNKSIQVTQHRFDPYWPSLGISRDELPTLGGLRQA